MPLITNKNIEIVAKELSRRHVKLYHACQLNDFKSYLQIGGIPSRNFMEERNLPYTKFDTDKSDKKNNVWNLVFFNLSDFGQSFASGSNNLPNPFGPILLCFDPSVLYKATDISITLRSAGAKDFCRVKEGISVCDIERLFLDPYSNKILYKEKLVQEFGHQKVKSPELSCLFCDEFAPFSYLINISVDPYRFYDEYLINAVERVIKKNNKPWKVQKRYCDRRFLIRYQTLFDAISSGIKRPDGLKDLIQNDSSLSDWRDAILKNKNLCFQFERYAKYLYEGTISNFN